MIAFSSNHICTTEPDHIQHRVSDLGAVANEKLVKWMHLDSVPLSFCTRSGAECFFRYPLRLWPNGKIMVPLSQRLTNILLTSALCDRYYFLEDCSCPLRWSQLVKLCSWLAELGRHWRAVQSFIWNFILVESLELKWLDTWSRSTALTWDRKRRWQLR